MTGEAETWNMVTNGERMSKARSDLERTHMRYIKSEECPAKLELQKDLQELGEEWLSVQPYHRKFQMSELPTILGRSLLEHPNEEVALAEVASAFLALARYASNLIAQPWRSEFKTIKLYGGFYQQEVGCVLVEVDHLMMYMGFELDDERHSWVAQLSRQQALSVLPRAALDYFLAATECQLMSRIMSAVSARQPQLTLFHVVMYRREHVGSWQVCVRGLLYESRAHTYALSQTATTPMPHMPPIAPTVSYGYCMYQPVSQQPLYPGQPQQQQAAATYPLMEVPPPPPPPAQYVPESGYQYNSKPSYVHSPPPYMYPEHQQQQPYYNPAPVYQPSFVYPNTEYQASSAANIPPHLLYDQSAVLIDFSAPQPRYEQLPLSPSSPPPRQQQQQLQQQESHSGSNFASHNGRQHETDKPSKSVHHNSRPKHTKHSPPAPATQPTLSPKTNSDDEDHSWEYVFRNLEIQGYNKDLGERGDLLKPSSKKAAINIRKPVFDEKVAKDKLELDRAKVKPMQLRMPSMPRKDNVVIYKTIDSTLPNTDSVSPPTISKHHSSNNNNNINNNNNNNKPKNGEMELSAVSAAAAADGGGGWDCHACTFLNDSSKAVCAMCGKSRQPGPEVRPPNPGPQCPQCTLVNPVGRDYCDACGACLRPTYI